MSKDSKNQEIHKNQHATWPTQADVEVYSSEWIGAIIRYFWHLGKREFNTLYTSKESKKNILVGWFFKIILVAIVTYIGFLYLN